MHVNAFKRLFEYSIFITLTHSTSHPLTLHVSFPFETDRQNFALQRAQRYCGTAVATGDACSNGNAIANITCIGLETQSDPDPTVLVINENQDFLILVNCKTPIYCSQIIVTSPDQKPPNGGDCKGNGTFYFRELTRLVKYDLLARI